MEIAVYNIEGKDTGKKVHLNDAIFAIEPNDHAIWLDVKQYLANQRQGTHSSLHRGIVSGSTRKLKKQKGSGSARYGSIKSPLFTGGGRVFGPEPRDYSFKLNRKLKQLARKSAFSMKVKNNQVMVVEDFSFDQPKTKEMLQIKKNLNIADKKSLLILAQADRNILLSSRNLPGTLVTTVTELTTYHIMDAKSVVLTESTVAELDKMF